ncbi:hypothetical protein [Stenotrophomonas maltophilia]|nr:hypothetical protein [Stenotrophomonas maltophilia]MBH1668033.1 hypothetical protein [Stenotrophomonas maltophilia]MBN5153273.1 hypothetical protein [Stenotrophomonas maltophilia]
MDETVYDAAWRAYKAAPRALANGPSRSAVRAAVDAAFSHLMPAGSTPAFFADRELRRAVAADLMELGRESQKGHWPAMRATYTIPLFRLPLPTNALNWHQCVPPMWLSEQIGGPFDDLTPGQAWRDGFNECRTRTLLLIQQELTETGSEEETTDAP